MSAFDDYLKGAPQAATQSFDAYLAGAPASAPVAASAAAPAPAPTQAPAPAVAPAPAQPGGLDADLAAGGASPGTASDLLAILQAGGHGAGSMINNAANLVEKGVSSGLNAIPGVRNTALARAVANTANADVAAQSATDKQFSDTATPGQKAAAFIAPLALPVGQIAKGGTMVAQGIRALPTMGGAAGRVIGAGLGNAATGAAFATGSPVDSSQPYWPQVGSNVATGAVLGAGLPAGVAAAGAAARGARNVLEPVLNPQGFVGRGLASAIGPDASMVASRLRNAPQYVNGVVPTTAQAAAHPLLVATEKAAANSYPDFKIAFAARQNADNQARWDTLNSIARTPADLDAALAARQAAAEPAYQAARAQLYPVDVDLSSLMDRPAMRDALARGVTIARNEGNQGLIPAVQGQAAQHANVPTGGVAFNGQPVLQSVLTRAATPGQPAQISGDVLHYIKLGLDDLQQSAKENTRLGPSERNAINTAQRDFVSWLDNTSGDYAHARQAYAANSPPVNTMQAGQQIAARLSGQNKALNTSGTPLMTAPGFATARDLALRAQEFGIDPAAEQSLTNIGNDLQRSTISNSLRAGSGSDTGYNLASQGWLAQNLYGPGFQGATGLGKAAASAATALAGHPIAALGVYGAANKLGQAVGKRLQGHLSNFLLDPDALIPYLDAQASPPINAAQRALAAALKRNVLPLAVGAGTGR